MDRLEFPLFIHAMNTLLNFALACLLNFMQTYDKIGIAALITTLSNLFVIKPHLICLVSATVRNEETLGAFFSACGKCS